MRAEVGVGPERRRRWSVDEKLRIVREAFAPAARVADVARRRDVSRAHLLALAEADSWIEQGANILCFGPSGTDKSHAAAAIGYALIEHGRRVLFTRTTDMVQRLQAARRDLSLPALIAKLDRLDCLVLGDLGYARKDQAETAVLFELIAERYERRSLIVTCNQPFSAWEQIFPDPPPLTGWCTTPPSSSSTPRAIEGAPPLRQRSR